VSREHFSVFAGKSSVGLRMVAGLAQSPLVGAELNAAYGARPGSGISETAPRLET
jgi:hypothetical protein